MYDVYNDLADLCETTSREIKEANDKIRNSGGKISSVDLGYIDKLTHILKSIKTTMAMMDAEDEGSYRDGSYNINGTYNNGSMRRGSYRNDGTYARGRGRNAKRDSMGRYSSRMSRDDRAYDDGMMDELRELMEDAPNEQIKKEFQQFISRIENQM